MQRRTFDILVSAIGALMVVVLVVAGALLMWGYSFTNNYVHTQLSEQQITFPTHQAFAAAKPGTEVTPGMRPYLEQYAGQQLTTGPQAEAYANHFIAVHLSEMPFGGVYSKASAAAQANPGNQKLAQEVDTIFKGTTLRGLLLSAYAFSMFGTIAFWAGIAAFALGAMMAVLVVLGFVHARRTPDDEELLGSHHGAAA